MYKFFKVTLKFGLIAVVMGLLNLACANNSNPCGFNFNPELSCRILDELDDGTKLIEYFDIDTNELSLFIYKNGEKTQIQHPKDRVKNFTPDLKKNSIKFSRQKVNVLVVNGEEFEIRGLS